MELYLIRHGKTPGNEEKRYVGRTEESLSETGRRELLGKQAPAAEVLFSSPMKRCVESCQCLYPGMEPIVIDAFREIDFGTFEGKNYQELSGNKDYQAWIDSGGTMAFPQGESRQDFIQRNLAGFQELLMELRKHPKDELKAAAVVHGGTVMSILSGAYGGDYYDYQIPNGEGYKVCMKLEENNFQILSAERI
ncbi:MAG: histidine phosphatase family protein [Lachnospiraceae bacterium]|nr:histidine phosphatase family protein [Lachnospiraceae bacterium]